MVISFTREKEQMDLVPSAEMSAEIIFYSRAKIYTLFIYTK